LKERVVLNLKPSDLGFEPELWELSEDLSFLHRKFDEETLSLFDNDERGFIEEIFGFYLQCQPQKLITRLKIPKIKTLADAMKSKELEIKIRKWHHENLHHLLQKYLEWSHKIAIKLDRKDYVLQKLIKYDPREIGRVKFYIKKETNGLTYRLELLINEREQQIRTCKIEPITIFPSWVLINNQLIHLPDVKSGFIIPFNSKDEVYIKEDLIEEFFLKIVRPYISKADFSLVGFPSDIIDTISAVTVQFQKHLFHQSYGYVINWHYGDWIIKAGISTNQLTRLDINETGIPHIKQYIRDQELEATLLEKIESCIPGNSQGLFIELKPRYFDIEEVVNYLRSKWSDIEEFKMPCFKAELIDDNGNSISYMPYQLEKNIQEKPDWLDLKISVVIGEQRIHFSKIVEAIRNKKNLIPLKDTTHFLIPEFWKSKYEGLIKYSTIVDDTIHLEKRRIGILYPIFIEDEIPVHSWPIFNKADLGSIQLRPYQLEGVSWLLYQYQNGYGGLLADDMGLGKTVQILAFLKLLYAKIPKKPIEDIKIPKQLSLFEPTPCVEVTPSCVLRVLIVAPSTVCLNWVAETKKFVPKLNIYQHAGTSRASTAEQLTKYEILLVSYHLLRQDAALFLPIEFDILILDEAQIARNPNSELYQVLLDLKVRSCFALSGTPIENSPIDLWAIIHLIDQSLLPKKEVFLEQCKTEEGLKVSNTDKSLLQPHMLRRTKKMVLKDLPDLEITTRYIQMETEQHALYQRELSRVRNEVNSEINPKRKSLLIITALMKLRQIANHPLLIKKDVPSAKFEATCEILQELRNKKEKCLIFSSFEQHLLLFKKHIEEQGITFQLLSGGTPQNKRMDIIDNFEKSDNPFLFITLKSGGTGINLVAASYVILLDPWWNPASEMQAIARAYRIGQTQKVTAIKMLTLDTLEEKIQRLQESKQALADDFFEAMPTSQLTNEQMNELLV
jgi:SNF2 family DNA or RNA helicase